MDEYTDTNTENISDEPALDFDERPEKPVEYIEDDIKTLDWREHIRLRPGMYIGKLGDGSYNDDGIYVLLKEVIDNAIDEYSMGYGRQISVSLEESTVTVRDHGRGIPLGKLVDVASKMNTGAKYDSKAFKKVVGLNGVGIKAVNALSDSFEIRSYRDGMMRAARFERGELIDETGETPTDEPNGTYVRFTPDNTIFRDFRFNDEFIVTLLRNYTYLNTGLAILFNGKRYISRNGLLDLLKSNLTKDPLYPIIHLKGDDIEIALTHANQYGEEYYSFVNGQHTTQGGTHLTALKESVSRTIKEYFGKNFEYTDIRNGMIAAVSVKVEEPVFESQKVNLHNSKLRDCRVHLNDTRGDEERKLASSIFLTEGDSASGSITKIRDVETQAVFSLRGKPLNSFGLTRKVVYENEEFNLLQAALNIEDGLDGLRYNNVIIATDADVDGMHIRLLLLTFFLQFFPDLVKQGHVYVLQTPLFRVRDKNATKRTGKTKKKQDDSETPDERSTVYCYSDEERVEAIRRFGANAEITRFKGLGEISPDEFRGFIGPDMRLDRVTLRKDDGVSKLLEFYMGKNTSDRQGFIINNLVVEDDSQIS